MSRANGQLPAAADKFLFGESLSTAELLALKANVAVDHGLCPLNGAGKVLSSYMEVEPLLGVTSESATYVGYGSNADGHGTAIGYNAYAANEGSAFGKAVYSEGYGVACGQAAYAGPFTIAIGNAAIATGSHGVALGNDTSTSADYQIVIGKSVQLTATVTPAIEIFVEGGMRITGRPTSAGPAIAFSVPKTDLSFSGFNPGGTGFDYETNTIPSNTLAFVYHGIGGLKVFYNDNGNMRVGTVAMD
ncbi:MAG: hypothetical protein E6R03_02230 [Hyphomicrobiaceae bacterium]|nr:MAG: hypothetical protein E6R03_02230 [Hyphomicrobiaceae bacterium]